MDKRLQQAPFELVQLKDVNINNTQELTGAIIQHTKDGAKSVQFFAPARTGSAVIQRVRVKISRVRKSMMKKNKRIKYFLLCSHITPWTMENGVTYDSVICWTVTTQQHNAIEALEEILGGSETI